MSRRFITLLLIAGVLAGCGDASGSDAETSVTRPAASTVSAPAVEATATTTTPAPTTEAPSTSAAWGDDGLGSGIRHYGGSGGW